MTTTAEAAATPGETEATAEDTWGGWLSGCDLSDEEEIVWLEDPAALPYVREDLLRTHTRRRPIRHPYGKNRGGKPGEPGKARTVGYSTLKPGASRSGRSRWYGFERRVFWLKEFDRANQAFRQEDARPTNIYTTTCPSEAVDPLTIAPGLAGRMTERAWGKPMPSGGSTGPKQ